MIGSLLDRHGHPDPDQRHAQGALQPAVDSGAAQPDQRNVGNPGEKHQPEQSDCDLDPGQQQRVLQHRRPGGNELWDDGDVEQTAAPASRIA